MAFSYSEDLFLLCFLGHICLFQTRFFSIYNLVSLQAKDSKWKVREAPECQPLNPPQNRGDDQVSRKGLRFGRQNPYGCWRCTRKKERKKPGYSDSRLHMGGWLLNKFSFPRKWNIFGVKSPERPHFLLHSNLCECRATELCLENHKKAGKTVSPEVTWSQSPVCGTIRLTLFAKGRSFSFNTFMRRKCQFFSFVGSDLAF